MEACDIRGKTISIGSYARYNGTGTTGQIENLKKENNTMWAKFNDKDLWYSLDTLEVIKEDDIKKFNKDDDNSEKVKYIKDNAKDNAVSNFSDVDACGAG